MMYVRMLLLLLVGKCRNEKMLLVVLLVLIYWKLFGERFCDYSVGSLW